MDDDGPAGSLAAVLSWGPWFWASGYDVAREVLQRGVAVLLVVAFVVVVRQWRPLLGSRGLTPARDVIARTTWRDTPSVLRWRCTDRFVAGLGWGGVVLAGLLVVGVPQLGPWWVTTLAFGALWAAYLSVVNVGGRFYGFGWESLLCEVTFLVAFLGSSGGAPGGGPAPPVLILVAARWCLFRVELGAGLIKIRGDRAWRSLTALDFHHETQPLPGPLSWHAHHAPRWWHRVEVAGNHVTQLVVPWAFFAPQPVASVAGGIVVLTQAWLVVTGNFAWLNWLTIVLGAALVSDASWAWLGGLVGLRVPDAVPAPAEAAPSASLALVVVAVTALLLVLSWKPARNLVSRRQLMNASFDPLRLVNAYGAFGSVSRRRDEVVVEGSAVARPGPEDWVEYAFRGKPGDVTRRPPQVAPYHLRLDWQMWFLALGSPSTRWFEVLLLRLLEGDAPTLRLLRADPFAGADGGTPRWVRARAFRYRFSTRAERRESGAWWVRREVAALVDPVDLARLRSLLGPGV